LFTKYDSKFGSTRSQKPTHPAVNSGKRKQAWERIFRGPKSSAIVGPPPLASVSTSSQSAASVACELIAYLDSDNVTAYEDDFDLLLWWRDHKLTYPVLSLMTRDIMVVSVSTVSSESCFSLTRRIIEERRRRLLPKHVEMFSCIKDWGWVIEDFSILLTIKSWQSPLRICILMFLKMDLGLLLLAHLQVHLLLLLLLLPETES
jgi:hypothetical protein